MAIYRLSMEPLSRQNGRSATASAAYRSGTKIHDQRTGMTWDFTRRSGVEHAEIVLPASASDASHWAHDRSALWNAAELSEKRKDARTAREYGLALPHEFTRAQQIELVRRFSRELASRYQVAVDFAIHLPHSYGDDRNIHAHVLTTTRAVTATGLGAKTAMELSNTDLAKQGLEAPKRQLETLRAYWADIQNEKFRELGMAIRVDHRTLKAQGIEREPTSHLGPTVSALHRRGMESEVGRRIAAEQRLAAQQRIERLQQIQRLERERRQIGQSIRDVSADLAMAQRDLVVHQPSLNVENIRKKAREEWLALRAERLATEQAPAAAEKSPEKTPKPDVMLTLEEPRAASERLSRLNSEELQALIQRINPPPVERLVEIEPAVVAARAEVENHQLLAHQVLLRVDKAAQESHAWRLAHGVQARLHELGVMKAAYLVEREAAGSEAERRRADALTASGRALEELARARREASQRITQETAPARTQVAELRQLMTAAHERERLVTEFEQLASGRAAGWAEYQDSSQEWQAMTPKLRRAIDAYNREPPQVQAQVLERFLRTPALVELLGEDLKLRRAQVREHERDQSRDLEL